MGLTRDFVTFTDRNGVERKGKLLREYRAFEGDIRYSIEDIGNGRDYRCVKKDGKFVELVV